MRLVLDSGAVTFLAGRNQDALATQLALQENGLWPPVVPTVVLVESLTGHPGRDAPVNRFIKGCSLEDSVPAELARRAALLRAKAHRGSAVDALVVAAAEPGGRVLTRDIDDIEALALHARSVSTGRP